MTEVINGRYTAQVDEPFVVFVIGARINQIWKFSKWLPVVQAMPKMLKTLYTYPEKGFLGAEQFYRFSPIATLMLSYWRSFEDLENFARRPSDPHLPAWKAFNESVGSDGSVGIWHETYKIQPDQYEAIYGNMPIFGLAAATKHIPIVAKSETAQQRMENSHD